MTSLVGTIENEAPSEPSEAGRPMGAQATPRHSQGSLSSAPSREMPAASGKRTGPSSELEVIISAMRQDEKKRRWRQEESERAERRHQAQLRQLEMAVQGFQRVTDLAGELLGSARFRPYTQSGTHTTALGAFKFLHIADVATIRRAINVFGDSHFGACYKCYQC